jgi:hypothetical protein
MRIVLYAFLLLSILIAMGYAGWPLRKYIDNIKSVVAADTQQQGLIQLEQRSVLMKSALMGVMQANPSIAQVRIAMIHSGITPNGDILWQWDRIGIATAPGFTSSVGLSVNKPLVEWDDFLGVLLNGRCAFLKVAALKDAALSSRLSKETIVALTVCPILNQRGQLIGAIFGNWSSLDAVPNNQEPVQTSLQAAANLIATKFRIGLI